MWESRVLQRAFERLELHEGKLSRAVLRGGGGGDVTSLPDPQGSNPLGPPGPSVSQASDLAVASDARWGSRPMAEHRVMSEDLLDITHYRSRRCYESQFQS